MYTRILISEVSVFRMCTDMPIFGLNIKACEAIITKLQVHETWAIYINVYSSLSMWLSVYIRLKFLDFQHRSTNFRVSRLYFVSVL